MLKGDLTLNEKENEINKELEDEKLETGADEGSIPKKRQMKVQIALLKQVKGRPKTMQSFAQMIMTMPIALQPQQRQ